MAISVIPTINVRGYYVFDSPYNIITDSGLPLTCVSLRNLKEFSKSITNAYELIYKNYNLDKTIYESDLENNVIIAAFTNDGNTIYYIPVNYITRAVDTTGYLYKDYTLSLDLGLLKENIDLSGLLSLLNGVVKDYMGVIPKTQYYKGPISKYMSVEDSKIYEQGLINNKTLYKSYYQLYQEQLTLNNNYKQALETMATYLKDNGFIS